MWVRLSSLLIAGSTPLDLRSDVLRAGELSYAFLGRRCLQVARAWPWRLCRGDALEALARLGEGGTVDEGSTTAKLQRLARSGYSMEMLSTGIALLAQAPWSTRCVEQAHGSLAQLTRRHPRVFCRSGLAAKLFASRPSVVRANCSGESQGSCAKRFDVGDAASPSDVSWPRRQSAGGHGRRYSPRSRALLSAGAAHTCASSRVLRRAVASG